MEPTRSHSLAARTVRSIGWKVSANLASVAILLVRAVVLARLLEVATFGVYSLAFAIVKLSAVVAAFGLGGALVHRDPETADEDRAATLHLTLTLALSTAWAAAVAVAAAFVADPRLRLALLVLTAATFALQLAQTPTMLLVRRVQHRRLAAVDLAAAAASTVAAVALAVGGAELWALLATDVATAAASVLLLYAWRPVWRPRLGWSPDGVRYFLRFGARGLTSNLLAQIVERADALWTGIVLGAQPLGFYSRAVTFAGYPRRVVANAINLVAAGSYAELKTEPDRLSRLFRQVSGALLWIGFGVAGVLAVAAPEVIELVLGRRWLPMLVPFRLLLLFALAAPIEQSLANLFTAVGEPGWTVRARAARALVLGTGLVVLGPRYGIAGVAAAVTAAIAVGVALLALRARRHVRFSVAALVGPPAAAAAVASVAALAAAATATGVAARAAVALAAYGLVYGGATAVVARRAWPGLRGHLAAADREPPSPGGGS